MTFADLVIRNRSYRRFKQAEPLGMDTLRGFVDLARQTPSGANLQPLRYVLSNDPETNAAIFATLGWAAYMPKWAGPEEGERPVAYVVVCQDTQVAESVICDQGIAAQTIMLAAVEKGFGGCMLASINREKLAAALNLPEHLHIMLVLALGVPAEDVVIEHGMSRYGDKETLKYWRDDAGTHHVPKRALDDIIVACHGA